MKYLIFILFFCSLNCISAQLKFEKTKHDFGDLDNSSDRTVDIEVKNMGKKKEYFLSFRKPAEMTSLSKGDAILPDSTNFIRIQANPKQKGKFSYQLQVFSSDKQEATIITVSGNFIEKPENSFAQYQACPDFSVKPVKRAVENKFTLITRDAVTKIPVNAKVFLIQNGTDVSQVQTKNGSWIGKIPLGFTYFYAKSESYLNVDSSAYINVNRNEMILEFKKNPNFHEQVPVEIAQVPEKNPDEIVLVTTKVEDKPLTDKRLELKEELSNSFPPKTDTIPNVKLDQISLHNFDEKYFRPINVVFVLDVSSSMGNEEKFDLLKFSLNQLLDVLRPQDKISFVTYATQAEVLLPSCSGSEKDKILTQIKKLKASGQTAGVDGIKLGFKEANKNLIADGSNMVIVITDGAFNKGKDDYLKVIEKNYEKTGVLFSVVGIKNLPYHQKNLEEAASKGNGAYVPVFKLVDAQQNLIREIKRVTFIQK